MDGITVENAPEYIRTYSKLLQEVEKVNNFKSFRENFWRHGPWTNKSRFFHRKPTVLYFYRYSYLSTPYCLKIAVTKKMKFWYFFLFFRFIRCPAKK